GLRENVEDYSYDKITNIKLEKGMFSSTLVITAPGMGTAARASNLTGVIAWGRKEDGMIDAIPKEKAEQVLKVVRNGMEEARKAKLQPSVTVQQTTSIADELAKLAKLKDQGILTDEEFTKMKQDLINKK
ncbi:MAG: SHOCT domain-containing protein, partial [Nitrosopumilaceae archaeon]|nr:SHOCT domain-containing protein [Nitrosopumilaceae archaeon]